MQAGSREYIDGATRTRRQIGGFVWVRRAGGGCPAHSAPAAECGHDPTTSPTPANTALTG